MSLRWVEGIVISVLAVEFIAAVFGLHILFHLGTAIFLLIGLVIPKQKQKWHSLVYCVAFLISIQSLAKGDLSSLLFAVSNLLCVVAFSKIGPVLKISELKLLLIMVFGVVLPLTLILFVVPIPLKIPETLGVVVYTFSNRFFPSFNNEYTINIFPANFSKHFTGEVGVMLFVLSFYSFLKQKRFTHLLLVFASLYLIFFSNARTAICIFLACIVVYWLNKKNIRTVRTLGFLVLYLACFYLIEDFFASSNLLKSIAGKDFLIEKLKVENESGVTAGRSFLWNYHLMLFVESPFLGAKSELITFNVGDWLKSGEVAMAGGESFYTGCLARYGLLGLFFPLLHLHFLFFAFNSKNVLKIIFAVVFILGNVFNSDFQNVYGALSPVMYILLFANCTPTRRVEPNRSNSTHASWNVEVVPT